MIRIQTPIKKEDIDKLKTGDMVSVSGRIYTGRDAVLPKIVKLIEEGSLADHGIDLEGSVIFHTALSPAGIGPTSSNKLEIEGTMKELSQAGVRMHLGKGALSKETAEMLAENGAVFAVTPPVTALFESKMTSKRVVAFEEEGMEAFHEIEVEEFPAIIAIAHGESIYDRLEK